MCSKLAMEKNRNSDENLTANIFLELQKTPASHNDLLSTESDPSSDISDFGKSIAEAHFDILYDDPNDIMPSEYNKELQDSNNNEEELTCHRLHFGISSSRYGMRVFMHLSIEFSGLQEGKYVVNLLKKKSYNIWFKERK